MKLDTLVDFGSIIGAFLAAIGFLVSLRQFKLSRTMSYMQHLSDPSIIEIRVNVDAWLDSSDDDNARLLQLQEDTELHTKVKVFLSFCNQISIAYRFGAIHNKMAFDIWNPFIPYYWDRLRFYIAWRRSQGYSIGHNLERFARDIRSFNRK
ncbi:hypothetical protein [Moorena sp. SIO4G3]|uniref:DUF4760 domain-containing protein n=1 Tax=Moorena sp. SIO4G3 TaxID=2607821 RepID=UPI00142A9024|nr:hypothetical protein [Moorena sp. SIO4G3]NEO78086.1 hypothetical protein [Moorena sp. SIO4G3]